MGKAEFICTIGKSSWHPPKHDQRENQERACRLFPTPLLFSQAKTSGVVYAGAIYCPIASSLNLVWCLTDAHRVRTCAIYTSRNSSVCNRYDAFPSVTTHHSSASLAIPAMASLSCFTSLVCGENWGKEKKFNLSWGMWSVFLCAWWTLLGRHRQQPPLRLLCPAMWSWTLPRRHKQLTPLRLCRHRRPSSPCPCHQ